MKRLTKIVAVVLSLVMLCGVVPAFAADAKPVYVVIGDSIAAGTGLQAPDKNSYGALVAATNGYEYINYAIPGHTTKNLMKIITENEAAIADLERADIISMSIGGNNFLLGNLPMLLMNGLKGDYSPIEKILEDFRVDFDIIVTRLRELNPDAVILLQTLYNPNYRPYVREVYQAGVVRLNPVYRSYDGQNGFHVIDVEPVFEGHKDYIARDSIHPNFNGHRVIAGLLLEKLNELGLGTATEPITTDAPETSNFFELIFIFFKSIFLSIINLFK